MTPQEQEMIDGLVQRIRSTPVTDKDLDAERYLQQGLASSPDALYVLAQTVLVQQYGLQQAQAQLRDLRSQLDDLQSKAQAAPSNSGGSFLSHLFGGSGPTTQTSAPPATPPYQPVNNPGYPPPSAAPAWAAFGGQSATPPAYAQPMMYPAQPVGYAPAGGGGFLRGALQTAAGVAAGEMAFASMESLFHGFGGGGYGGGFGGGGFGGGGFGGGGFEGAPREEIVNNYYGDAENDRREEHSDFSREDRDDRIHDTNFVSDDNDRSSDTSTNDDGFDSYTDDSSSTSDDSGSFSDDGSNSF